MLPGIAAITFENSGTPSPGNRRMKPQMNKKPISSCFHCIFSIIPAVIRCYFTRQNPKLTTISTCCLIGEANFLVFTVNTARTSPRPSTQLRSPIRVQGQRSRLLTDHSPLSAFAVHPSLPRCAGSPFTAHGSRFTLSCLTKFLILSWRRKRSSICDPFTC